MSDQAKPYIAVATFCEKALEEKDGVYTLVRIIDSVTVRVDPALARQGKPAIQVTLFVIFRAGDAHGKYTVAFVLREPNAAPKKFAETSAIFTGEERGVTLRTDLVLGVEEYGLYWVDVLVNGEKATSVPLRLQRAEEGTQSSQTKT